MKLAMIVRFVTAVVKQLVMTSAKVATGFVRVVWVANLAIVGVIQLVIQDVMTVRQVIIPARVILV